MTDRYSFPARHARLAEPVALELPAGAPFDEAVVDVLRRLTLAVELDLAERFAAARAVTLVWRAEDVALVRPDLSADECWRVLQAAHEAYDPEYGLTWTTLARTAAEMFGPPPEQPANPSDAA